MDPEMQAVIARLDGITRRMDDAQELSYQRHEENIERFRDLGVDVKAVENEARKTNGRLATVEAEIRGIWARIKSLGRKDDGEAHDVTLGDLKWYIACAAGGFGAALGLLKLMGKL